MHWKCRPKWNHSCCEQWALLKNRQVERQVESQVERRVERQVKALLDDSALPDDFSLPDDDDFSIL